MVIFMQINVPFYTKKYASGLISEWQCLVEQYQYWEKYSKWRTDIAGMTILPYWTDLFSDIPISIYVYFVVRQVLDLAPEDGVLYLVVSQVLDLAPEDGVLYLVVSEVLDLAP